MVPRYRGTGAGARDEVMRTQGLARWMLGVNKELE